MPWLGAIRLIRPCPPHSLLAVERAVGVLGIPNRTSAKGGSIPVVLYSLGLVAFGNALADALLEAIRLIRVPSVDG